MSMIFDQGYRTRKDNYYPACGFIDHVSSDKEDKW